MKKLLIVMICLTWIYTSAQQTADKTFGEKMVGGMQSKVILSVGAGVSNPNATVKTNNNIGSLNNINVGAYVPIVSFGGATGGVVNYGGATGGVISLGFNTDIAYLYGNKDYDVSNYTPYNILGQSGTPSVAAKGAGSPKQPGFKTEAGLQANFSFGKITLSPVLNGAYFSLKQKDFKVTQSSNVNGTASTYNLYHQAESKTSGIAIIPKVQIRYKFGRDNKFSIYTEANYLIGPKVNTQSTSFKPNGAPVKEGSYNIDQMISGTNVAQNQSAKYSSLGVNVGVSYSFFSKKGYDSWKAHSDIAKASTNTNPYFVGNANEGVIPQNQSVVNTTKSNTKDYKVQDNNTNKDPQTGQERRVEVLKSNKNTKQMPITYIGKDRLLKNAKLSILGTGETLTNGTPLVAGSKVSGKVSGLASGTTLSIKQPETGDEGTAITDAEGNFTIALGRDTLHRIYINNEEFGTIKIEDNEIANRPGSPIKGIIVKGGKNPRGNMITLTTNAAGAFEFNANESGNYEFTLTNPIASSQNRPGSPIKGIIVKGGKNPGGNMITVAPNAQGKITLSNLAAGNYKFTITKL